jgi:mycothiol synthase
MADIDQVVGLINRCSLALTGAAGASVADLRRYWEDPKRDLATDNWVVAGEAGHLVAGAELYEFPPYTEYEYELYVDPTYQGRGIGAHLRDLVEVRCRETMHLAPPGERVYLLTPVWAQDDAGRAVLERDGFRHVRDWSRMEIELSALPTEAQWPDGISVCSMTLGQDERAVWLAVEDAFQDHWGYAPLPFDEWHYYKIENVAGFDPALYFLAIDEASAEIAGIALCRSESPGDAQSGYVVDLGVRRAWRRRGLALALLQHAFREFYLRGKRRAVLTVDAQSLTGADRVYERAGMSVTLRQLYFEKELRPAAPSGG